MSTTPTSSTARTRQGTFTSDMTIANSNVVENRRISNPIAVDKNLIVRDSSYKSSTSNSNMAGSPTSNLTLMRNVSSPEFYPIEIEVILTTLDHVPGAL